MEEDNVFVEYEIDWNDLFTELLDPSPVETFSNPLSPDVSVSSWAMNIESLLMKDDNHDLEPLNQQSLDDFFSDILADSPPPAAYAKAVDDVATDKDSNVSDESVPVTSEEEGKLVHEGEKANDKNNTSEKNTSENDFDDDAGADDPIYKKRRRYI